MRIASVRVCVCVSSAERGGAEPAARDGAGAGAGRGRRGRGRAALRAAGAPRAALHHQLHRARLQ